MSKIFVVGIDGSGTLKQRRQILERCGLIVASKRLASLLGNTFVPIHPITPIDEAFQQIETNLAGGNVCVLASGDPLFFGIGGKLIERFGSERVIVFPALSSLQEAFARFNLSWDDANIVSLHGRQSHHIPGLLLGSRKTFAFTDAAHSPDIIATKLQQYLSLIGASAIEQACLMHVAENLGSHDEKITTGSLAEIAEKKFSRLNVICISLPEELKRPTFGLHEDDIAHSRGLITKAEVRAVTLHRLQLPAEGVFWDIGGGSGSISIEAASMNPQLTVYTVEHREEEIANIKENICRFNLFNIVPIAGRAVDHMAWLPAPERVFIGGSDGEMEAIITESAARLPENGRLVVNGVTEKTVTETPQLMKKYGFTVETTTIEVARSGPDGPIRFNPITIMVGRK